jgi:hypothetical protein
MSLPPHLTDEEVADITKPLTQGAARCKRLERMGFKVKKRPNGQPLVGRAHYEEVMAGRGAPAANDAPAPARNWSGLRDKVRYGRGPQEKRRQPARA